MEEVKKEKRKKKSLSSRIRDLQKKNSYLEDRVDEEWDRARKFKLELIKLRMLLPLKIYRIEFKMKSKTNSIVTTKEIVQTYTAELALEKVLENKIHPQTFELLDITLLA